MPPDDTASPDGRDAAFDSDVGTLVIYDTENPEAWLASDVTVADLLDGPTTTSNPR